MVDAKKRAEREYETYSTNRKTERLNEADGLIEELKHADKALPKTRRRKS